MPEDKDEWPRGLPKPKVDEGDAFRADFSFRLKRLISDELPVHEERLKDQLDREKKFVVAGNAGGLAASLSLSARWLQPAAEGGLTSSLPLTVFILICLFTVGLALCTFAMYFQSGRLNRTFRRAQKEARQTLEFLTSGEDFPLPIIPVSALEKPSKLEWICARAAATCLVVGVVLGLATIANFTVIPAFLSDLLVRLST